MRTTGRSKKPAETPSDASEPKFSKGPAPSAVAGKRPPLDERLPLMSDGQLAAQHAFATRIVTDPNHPKHAAAIRALPKIDGEIRKRRTASEAAPTPVAAASDND